MLGLAGCTTLKTGPGSAGGREASAGPGLDPAALVDPSATIIIRMNRPILDKVLPLFLTPGQVKALEPLKRGLSVAALAVLPRPSTGAPGGLPPFEAALVGDLPVFQAKLALAFSRDWRLRKGIWTNSGLGLGLAFPRRGLIVLASGSPEALLSRLASGAPGPFPPALAELSAKDMASWLPDPFGRLGESLLGERLDIPAEGILVAAKVKDGGYEVSLAFQMRDPDSARIYRPAARIAWFALARLLLPGEAGLASPRFDLEDRAIIARNLALSETGLASALARLGLADQ